MEHCDCIVGMVLSTHEVRAVHKSSPQQQLKTTKIEI